jgi:hypothetical protein
VVPSEFAKLQIVIRRLGHIDQNSCVNVRWLKFTIYLSDNFVIYKIPYIALVKFHSPLNPFIQHITYIHNRTFEQISIWVFIRIVNLTFVWFVKIKCRNVYFIIQSMTTKNRESSAHRPTI